MSELEATQLLDIQDVAKLLKVSEHTIRAWRQRGYGPASFKVGRHIRFNAAEVQRWLQEARHQK